MTVLLKTITELTLAEKAALCRGSDFWRTVGIERLGIPAIMVSDGPHGLRVQLDDSQGLDASVHSTCFPTASALASSWNVDLFTEVGQAIGAEAEVFGVAVVLGPGINIKRNPLCGRNFEYLSEDPWLSGALAIGMVNGIQSRGVGASLKHFAVNNQETDRSRVSADVDERTLREIYLAGFEHVVTVAQPWTVMCSYNRVNGTYASQHHWLLTEVLREEWGFTGLVMSDWGAVHDRVAAVAAGLDLEMPANLETSDAAIVAAVEDSSLRLEELDRCVERVLALVERSRSGAAAGVLPAADQRAHHDLARRAAHESAVLLKNDGGVLPLSPVAGETLAVIGEFARTPRFQGAGSSQVTATRIDVALDELRAGVPDGVTVAFAAGFTLDADEPGRPDTGVPGDAGDDEGAALRAEAVELARRSDHVVLFLGLPGSAESEGFDRDHLELPPEQIALLQAVTEVSDRVVVVLANGSAVRVAHWPGTAAILECWLSGQAAGSAAADLLLGRVSPSGKLAETIPLRLEDCSSFLNFPGDSGHVRYGEGIFVGYRGYDRLRQEVSYPFGHGLSYTTFQIADVEVAVSGSVADGDLSVQVSARVTNTGERDGAEVLQVYVRDVESSVARPVRELKAFTKVTLAPGESERVRLLLDERSFAYYSILHSRWVVEAGEFEVAVGSSSRALAGSVTIQLDAPSVRAPLDEMSSLQEWLADERGRALLLGDRSSGLPNDPAFLRVIESMPMQTLANFPGLGFTNARLADYLAVLNNPAERQIDPAERPNNPAERQDD